MWRDLNGSVFKIPEEKVQIEHDKNNYSFYNNYANIFVNSIALTATISKFYETEFYENPFPKKILYD